MPTYALDYSTSRPTAADVLAAGYVGVIRYIGFPSNRKCLTADEYADMTRAGVGVALVFERSIGDALQGRAAGQAAARLAYRHARQLGYPIDQRPVYYACDTDVVGVAQMAAVMEYLRGAGDVHGGSERVGVYGEYDVVEQAADAGVATWRWQTRAWSGGRLSARAQLRQEIGTVFVGGVACDRNTILATDWGQTGAEPAPAPGPAPWEGPDMFTVRRDDGLAFLVQPHRVQVISREMLDALTKAGVPLQDERLTEDEITAIGAALGEDPQAAQLRALAASDTQQSAQLAGLAAQLRTLTTAVTAIGGNPEPSTPTDPGFPGAVADAVLTRLREAFQS